MSIIVNMNISGINDYYNFSSVMKRWKERKRERKERMERL